MDFDLVTDPLTGFAESVDEIFGKVADYHDKRQWDYVIAITDLPMFADKQVMALDINMEKWCSYILISGIWLASS